MVLNNWKTTIIGIIFSILQYLQLNGVKLPENKHEWFNFVISLGWIAIGVVAKDFNVHGGTTQATDIEGYDLIPKQPKE